MGSAQELVSTDSSSGRTAIIEAAGDTLWFYLTQSGTGPIVSDCWLANLDASRGPLTDEERAALRDAGLPLPAPPNALAYPAHALPIDPQDYRLDWSTDGEAVRAMVGKETIAFIHANDNRGFHRNIGVECPWGHVFDADLHEQLFGGE